LKEVQKKLKYDQMEPAEKKRYNKFMENSLLTRSQYETALLLGREEGIKKGKEEGREEGKRQMVINCFVEGLPIELISKIAGLSVEEVEEILKEA
jgi:predicted transposase/invertase (TIGR01784 family)